jgi:HAD superfamily hydrolase (TIGR01549 family)
MIIARLLEEGLLAEAPPDPRVRAIPEWLTIATEFDAQLGAELWQEVDRFEREGMVHGTVEDDARITLDRLSAAGLKLAILTNNSVGSAEAALDRFSLRDPFDLVLAREVVPALKPSGVGVAKAHLELGQGPTFMVGDSWIDGMAAQRAACDARFVAFRANLADLDARGIQLWRSAQVLQEVADLLLEDVAHAD